MVGGTAPGRSRGRVRGWTRGRASGSRPAPDPPARDAGPPRRPRRRRRQRRSRGPDRRTGSRRPRRAVRSPRRGPPPGRGRVSPACPDPRYRCRGRPSRSPGSAGPTPAAARRSSPRSDRPPASPPWRLGLSRARPHPDRRPSLRRPPGDRAPPRPAPACTRRWSPERPASRAAPPRHRSPAPFDCRRSSTRSSASLHASGILSGRPTGRFHSQSRDHRLPARRSAYRRSPRWGAIKRSRRAGRRESIAG